MSRRRSACCASRGDCGVCLKRSWPGFFPDVSAPTVLPLGSPVLQRKAGYRELLRFWLQFHAGAQLAWDGGADVFEAGARNVATLYEYWLFFQLEALFRQRFACEQPLHALVVSREKVPPQLVLKRGVELQTPVAGVWSKTAGRHLQAEFHFNRKFTPRRRERTSRAAGPAACSRITPSASGQQNTQSRKRSKTNSWCMSFRCEISGGTGSRDCWATPRMMRPLTITPMERMKRQTAAKYADLLKMHAYRDAIRRTAGAYVLYPGEPGDGQRYPRLS